VPGLFAERLLAGSLGIRFLGFDDDGVAGVELLAVEGEDEDEDEAVVLAPVPGVRDRGCLQLRLPASAGTGCRTVVC
jgi:hypothetical protein